MIKRYKILLAKNGNKINEPYSKFQNKKVLTLANVLEDISFFKKDGEKGHQTSETIIIIKLLIKRTRNCQMKILLIKNNRISYQLSLRKDFLLAERNGK